MLLFGFFLGIAGTTFAVGIPFVNAWYRADRRGFATGVFGAGMGGTALSAFFTPRFVHVVRLHHDPRDHRGRAGRDGRDLSGRRCATRRCGSPTPTRSCPSSPPPLKLPVTWQMSFLYAVAFGGFVAFSTYLPTYLKDVYAFDLTAAGTRTAGFAIAAVVARPDRRHPVRPDRSARRRRDLARRHRGPGRRRRAPAAARDARRARRSCCSRSSSGSAPAACSPGSPRLAPPERVGSVTGIVGAAGGLGGFFPPLVMGATYDEADHSYTVGLILLCVTAVGGAAVHGCSASGDGPPPEARVTLLR